MKTPSKKLDYLVAEVKVVKEIKFPKEENLSPIEKGSVVTISDLDHPTDVKLWGHGTGYIWQVSPNHFDLKNPVRIIRKSRGEPL